MIQFKNFNQRKSRYYYLNSPNFNNQFSGKIGKSKEKVWFSAPGNSLNFKNRPYCYKMSWFFLKVLYYDRVGLFAKIITPIFFRSTNFGSPFISDFSNLKNVL